MVDRFFGRRLPWPDTQGSLKSGFGDGFFVCFSLRWKGPKIINFLFGAGRTDTIQEALAGTHRSKTQNKPHAQHAAPGKSMAPKTGLSCFLDVPRGSAGGCKRLRIPRFAQRCAYNHRGLVLADPTACSAKHMFIPRFFLLGARAVPGHSR